MKQLVLLGASNVTLAFGLLTRELTGAWGPGPYRILAAAGHGRAYGVRWRVWLRDLPPIADCGLWPALAGQRAMPTRAIVADVGNDLAFGATPAQAATAVRRCLERLRAAGAESVIALPPVTSVACLPGWRFRLYRSLLFPGRRFAHATIVAHLRELSERLEELAADVGARPARFPAGVFGRDGIHLRWSRRREAWLAVLGRWSAGPARAGGLPPAVRWSFLRAEGTRLPGRPRRRPQPARRLVDGSTLSLY